MKQPWVTTLCLSLGLVGGIANAGVILGAQLGKQYLDIRQTDGTGQVYEDTADADTSLGLIAGVGQPGGGSRITGEWNSFAIGGNVDLDLLNFSYSYFFPSIGDSPRMQLRPFLGGELGYGWLDVGAQTAFNGSDDSGILYGARAGLNLALSERVEIEVGMRYSVVSLEATLASKLPLAKPATYEVENNRGWWIGFNIGL